MESVAETVTTKVADSLERFWAPSDFPGSQSRVLHVLADLVDSGELRHIRRGLYWKGTKTPLGMAPPPAERLIARVAGNDGVGPAGPFAAHLLRLTTQVPRLPEYAVPGRAPTNLPGMKVRSRSARWKRREAKLRPLEVAILEVLDGWENLIDLSDGQALEQLRTTISKGSARPDNLRAAADTEPSHVRARLEQLLAAVS